MSITSSKQTKKRPIVLVTATLKEMRAFLPKHTDLSFLKLGEFYPWQYKDAHYILLTTGIGPINAAMSLGRLIGAGLDLSGVLNVGIAGSFDLQKFALGSLALISREIWPEFGLWTSQGLDCKELGWALGQTEQGKVWDQLELDPDKHCTCLDFSVALKFQRAVSLSVAGVTGCPERRSLLQNKYHADLENMEGFALAWTCLRHKLAFVQIRSISNLVGSRKKNDWDLSSALAGLREIFFCLND